MAKIQFSIRLEEDLLKLVDELALSEGRSRTEIIEGMLERWIGEEQRFSDVSKIPGLAPAIEKLAEFGVLGGLAKLLGREVDHRRVRMMKELREKRRGGAAGKLKGADL